MIYYKAVTLIPERACVSSYIRGICSQEYFFDKENYPKFEFSGIFAYSSITKPIFETGFFTHDFVGVVAGEGDPYIGDPDQPPVQLTETDCLCPFYTFFDPYKYVTVEQVKQYWYNLYHRLALDPNVPYRNFDPDTVLLSSFTPTHFVHPGTGEPTTMDEIIGLKASGEYGKVGSKYINRIAGVGV